MASSITPTINQLNSLWAGLGYNWSVNHIGPSTTNGVPVWVVNQPDHVSRFVNTRLPSLPRIYNNFIIIVSPAHWSYEPEPVGATINPNWRLVYF